MVYFFIYESKISTFMNKLQYDFDFCLYDERLPHKVASFVHDICHENVKIKLIFSMVARPASWLVAFLFA